MPMSKIRRQFSAKLSIGITLLAVPIFVVALGILFLYTRHIILQETVKLANGMLRTTTQRVNSNLNLVENAIHSNSWLLEEHFQPDSLEAICQRIVILNRTVNSCHVVTNPKEMVHIVQGYVVNTTATGDTLFTYSKALRPNGDSVKGFITATLSAKQLTKDILESERPSAGSFYKLLIGKDESCDDTDNLVFYSSLPGTDCRLALVCPEDEILNSYYQLLYLTAGLLLLGLLLVLIICYLLTQRTIRPLNQLLKLSKKIVDGHYDETIPHSSRQDAIGRLQNSFSIMQQSLYEHVGNIRETVAETQKHNKELAQTMVLVEEAVKKKELFIQNVLHQIRTPLNIIMGFADVLGDSLTAKHTGDSQRQLHEEEVADITDAMNHNAIHLNRMVQMLSDSSEYGLSHEKIFYNDDRVPCNTIAQECIAYTQERFPKVTIRFESTLSDNTIIQSNHLFLMRTLRELLFNAAKYSDGQHISLYISETATTIRFTVEDVGPGIAPESRSLIFRPFTKVDDLSEGLGLGLPLAKRHANNLGGDLILDDSYHDGCRFILTVPQ